MPLPLLGLSLHAYKTLLDELQGQGDYLAYTRAAVNGLTETNELFVDIIDHRINREGEPEYPLEVSRDIDSLIGISHTCAVNGSPVIMATVPNFTRSITKDIGLTCRVVIDDVSCSLPTFYEDLCAVAFHAAYSDLSTLSFHTLTGLYQQPYDAPLHQVPNIEFGQWQGRNELILAFPRLYDPENPTYKVPLEELHQFYELVTRKAIQETLGERYSNLAPTLDQAMFRARTKQGRISQHGRLLCCENVNDILLAMRRYVTAARLDWAEDFFLVHQVKGVKDDAFHRPEDAQAALLRCLASNHICDQHFFNTNDNMWFGDIALQISSLWNECLLFRTDAHALMMVHLLGISPQEAQRLAQIACSAYIRDYAIASTGASGFRAAHSSRLGGLYDVIRSQAYHTDKELLATLNEGGHYAKHILAKDVTVEKGDNTLDGIELSYSAAKNSRMEAHARFEVRVPASQCNEVFRETTLNRINIQDYLIALPTDLYWGLRLHLLKGLTTLIEWHKGCQADHRLEMNALVVVAAACWAINGLHATHDVGPSSRSLIEVVFPRIPPNEINDRNVIFRQRRHAQAGEDDGPRVALQDVDLDRNDLPEVDIRGAFPGYPPRGVFVDDGLMPAANRGMLWFRPFMMSIEHPGPRFFGAYLSETPFKYLFGSSYGNYYVKAQATRMFSTPHPNRTSTKILRPLYTPTLAEEGEILFHFGPRGKELIDPNTDVVFQEMLIGADGLVRTTYTWEERATGLYRQLFPDMMGLIPNPRGLENQSYSVKTEAERQAATEADFGNPNLALFLTAAVWKEHPVDDDWQKVIRFLFPKTLTSIPARAQNYSRCQYYIQWRHFLEHNDEETINRVHRAISQRLREKVRWLPSAECDRIWRSTNRPFASKRHSPNIGPNDTAPKVICSAPEWDETAIVRGNDDGDHGGVPSSDEGSGQEFDLADLSD